MHLALTKKRRLLKGQENPQTPKLSLTKDNLVHQPSLHLPTLGNNINESQEMDKKITLFGEEKKEPVELR